MDTNPSINMSPEPSVDHHSSDRLPGESVRLTRADLDDTIGRRRALQPQAQVFTLFKHLPAELQLLIWEHACALPEPRIHFLNAFADPKNTARAVWWNNSRWCWSNSCLPDSPRGKRVHWEVSDCTNDPRLLRSGRELLAVCVEAREAYLKLGPKSVPKSIVSLPSRRKLAHRKVLGKIRSTDIVFIRADAATSDNWNISIDPELVTDEERLFCHYDERPSPRRLALEMPASADAQVHLDPGACFPILIPYWLNLYGSRQELMFFHSLEVVYILDQRIKLRAQYEQQEGMPTKTYAEVFDGHHGSKFVAIDPEDKETSQHWIIPEYCWKIVARERPFPLLPNFMRDSIPVMGYDYEQERQNFCSRIKLRFLACVKDSSQTHQLDAAGGRPESPFAFT